MSRTVYRSKSSQKKLFLGVVLSLAILLVAGLAYFTVSLATKSSPSSRLALSRSERVAKNTRAKAKKARLKKHRSTKRSAVKKRTVAQKRTAQLAKTAKTAATTTSAAKPATPAAAKPAATPTPTPKPAPTPAPAPKPTPAPAPTQPAASERLAGIVIAIDPGHQARGDSSLEPIGPGSTVMKPKVSSGTRGVATGIPESQTVLNIGLKLRDALKRQGATVVMTRTTQNINIANSARASIANNARAGLFIRLHCDGSSSGSTHGISTLVPGTNQWTGPIVGASGVAGRHIQQALVSATGASSRGVIARSDLSGFNYCKVPVVLVEMGFMTNAAEDRNLNSAAYQQRLVNGYVQGVLAYFKR